MVTVRGVPGLELGGTRLFHGACPRDGDFGPRLLTLRFSRPDGSRGELKAKGMQINELSAAEAARMRDRLTRVNASIAANVGMELWDETRAALAALRK